MMSDSAIRPATPEDAPAMATIKNAWIDESDWLPRIQTSIEVERHYRDSMIPKRDVFTIGDPIEGFIAIDPDEKMVTSLFCKTKGESFGKRLLDFAKSEYGPALSLWSFEANMDAVRFYQREGFTQIDRAENESEEGLPDILLQWEAAA